MFSASRLVKYFRLVYLGHLFKKNVEVLFLTMTSEPEVVFPTWTEVFTKETDLFSTVLTHFPKYTQQNEGISVVFHSVFLWVL